MSDPTGSTQVYERWCDTHTLIIDEISMVSADLFSKVDQVGRIVRGLPHIPFGGLQVIVRMVFITYAPKDRKQHSRAVFFLLVMLSKNKAECFYFRWQNDVVVTYHMDDDLCLTYATYA